MNNNNNNNNIYKNKYLRYKKKYLELKNQIGGGSAYVVSALVEPAISVNKTEGVVAQLQNTANNITNNIVDNLPSKKTVNDTTEKISKIIQKNAPPIIEQVIKTSKVVGNTIQSNLKKIVEKADEINKNDSSSSEEEQKGGELKIEQIEKMKVTIKGFELECEKTDEEKFNKHEKKIIYDGKINKTTDFVSDENKLYMCYTNNSEAIKTLTKQKETTKSSSTGEKTIIKGNGNNSEAIKTLTKQKETTKSPPAKEEETIIEEVGNNIFDQLEQHRNENQIPIDVKENKKPILQGVGSNIMNTLQNLRD